jgi:hypothetical protein
MRYFLYLILWAIAQPITWIITWLLPLFSEMRDGPINNNNGTGVEPRLKKWLAVFDTPDNSLWGDDSFKAKHPNPTYWSKVAWLYRNSLYGFKWTVLDAEITEPRIFEGNPAINYRGPVYGTLKVKSGKYWQWKKVMPVFGTGYCLVLNFGWLLDDVSKTHALFMFSPRPKRVKP